MVFGCNVPCFHPLDAWQCSNGDVVFTDNLARNDVIRRLSLPCGRCVGCRLERSGNGPFVVCMRLPCICLIRLLR